MRRDHPVAFTLIELLIVVAIIGILAAIAVPNFLNAQLRAKIARVESDFKAISTAFGMYQIDQGDLPRIFTWADSWRRLTTPIAYMTIVPIDIFQPKQQELWVNQHHWYEYSACLGSTPMKLLPPGAKIDNWVLASLGPDFEDDTIQISDYPNSGKFLQYDMTNGLVSDGDILRESKPGFNPMRGG